MGRCYTKQAFCYKIHRYVKILAAVNAVAKTIIGILNVLQLMMQQLSRVNNGVYYFFKFSFCNRLYVVAR